MSLFSSVGDYFRESQVWNSIFRHGVPKDRRTRAMAVLSNVFLHLHPVAVRKSGIRLSFTWCMGGLTFFLFLAETITGVLLMFYYRPVVEYAYVDSPGLRAHVTLGLLREIHRWGAHAMVISIWLHMLRVFLTGSYKPPREFNWGVGVVLLTLTLLLSFTGYLLPWDQLAMWAITVGLNMARPCWRSATCRPSTQAPMRASCFWEAPRSAPIRFCAFTFCTAFSFHWPPPC